MKLFVYDSVNDNIAINDDSILLIGEFAKLYEKGRNKTKEDKTGEKKTLSIKEFKYIFLYIDWMSPYAQYTEQARHKEAFTDAGLTQKEFEDLDFKAACKKYDELQNSTMSMRLLKAARKSVESLIFYLEHVDLNERDPETGKPIFKSKDLIAEIKGCADVIAGLNDLENQVKKELEPDSGLRGETKAGYFD